MAVCLVKLRITVFLSAVLLLVSMSVPAFAQPSVSATCAALMVADTGELLYGKNEHDRRSMASTTKIMTSLIALEALTPQRKITVSADMLNVEGTSMGLLDGDTVTLEGLVYGMLLQSGNDAANVAAITLGGSVEKFVEMMNERAKQIGMSDTHFETPSGLDSEQHYSTAYDMALLGCEAIKNPSFAAICSQKSAAVCYGNPPYRRVLTNHNRLLKIYDDAVGIKTGFTKKSGRCLVSAARRNGVTLVAVTLNAPDDWNDHSQMLEYGFSLVESRTLGFDTEGLSLKVAGGETDFVSVKLARLPTAVFRKNSAADIKNRVFMKAFEYAPISENSVVGRVEFISGEKVIDSVELVTAGSVDAKKAEAKPPENKSKLKRFFEKIINTIRNWM